MRVTAFLVLAALVLGSIAALRGPEYDEAYSMFLTAGDARPAWPPGVFTAGSVRGDYLPQAGFGQIARDLKAGDVHPPLYFWLLEVWRRVFGPGWFVARLLSVGLSVGSLALVGAIAAEMGLPVLPAMALTLGCYGFAYTGVVARGFALAQVLNLLGFWLALRGRGFLGGVAFGAASFSNYLAVFSFASVLIPRAKRSKSFLVLFFKKELLLFLPFLFLDFSFFTAQRSSRMGQFVAFSWGHALALLARDSGAAVFGGLPVYFGVWVAVPLLGLFLMCLARARWDARLVAGACAPAVGLLGLGLVFGNTPIEIRYLAFGLPFLALMLAGLPRWLRAAVLVVQVCALMGLAVAPGTMQPQGAAARAAAGWPGALVLVPFGNDGVGVPGPVIAALPDTARVELLRGSVPDVAAERRVVLLTVRADTASRNEVVAATSLLAADTCFTRVRESAVAAVFLNRCANQQP